MWTLSSTGSLKLFMEVMVMIDVSELPFGMVNEGGEAVMSKSGSGGGALMADHTIHITPSDVWVTEGSVFISEVVTLVMFFPSDHEAPKLEEVT